jgi:hypothetical protein
VSWFVHRKGTVILGGRSGLLPRIGDGGFLPKLLIVTLLLCHGVLGYAHQVSGHACDSVPAGVETPEMHNLAKTGDASGGHPGDAKEDGPEGLDYAAVLFAVFAVAILVLFSVVRKRSEIAVFWTFGRCFRAGLVHPPRGPTLPSLQVFRL